VTVEVAELPAPVPPVEAEASKLFVRPSPAETVNDAVPGVRLEVETQAPALLQFFCTV
jgi:hypothetical protein